MFLILFFRQRNTIIKIPKFYEAIVPQMIPRNFRRYFRMFENTLENIIAYLVAEEPYASLLDKGRVTKEKKVAMTCAYLGSKLTIVQ